MRRQSEDTPLLNEYIPEGWNRSFICHPQAFCHRMIALFLMCFLGFGSYFCYDNPGALQHEILETMDLNTFQFASLYSWYAWPNVILPIIGGYLMDKVFGMRLGTILFTIFIVIGQIMFAMGAFLGNYMLMECGRFVFGIGGESLAVAQNTYAVAWFKGKELNMVFGFQLSVTRIGSTINFLVMGPLFHYFSSYLSQESALGTTLLLAGFTCVFSLLCALILAWMDKRANRLIPKTINKNEKILQLNDLLSFPSTFWLLCLIALSYYVAIFPFISLGQVFFMKKYLLDVKSANFLTGLIYLISAPASPILGFLIDKTGWNISYVFIAIIATLISHIILAFTFLTPYFSIILMGFGYSLLASALWPMAALIIPEYQLGTAYGLIQAIQNFGLAICTLLSGFIVDQHGYIWLEIFFIFWLVFALFSTVSMWVIDFYTTKYLNMRASQREKCELSSFDESPTNVQAGYDN